NDRWLLAFRESYRVCSVECVHHRVAFAPELVGVNAVHVFVVFDDHDFCHIVSSLCQPFPMALATPAKMWLSLISSFRRSPPVRVASWCASSCDNDAPVSISTLVLRRSGRCARISITSQPLRPGIIKSSNIR